MKLLALIFAAVCVTYVVASDDVDDGDVVVLTEANFEETLSGEPLALVEFYAPWCGHCKHLAPEWAQAATALKGKIPVCKVDATIEKELGNKYNVRGYPTIKLFRNGQESGDYQGPRTKDGIVEYVNRQLSPAVTDLDSGAEAKEFSAKDKVVVIGFVHDGSSEEKTFNDVASLLRDDFTFGSVTAAAIAAEFQATAPAIVLFKNSDKEQLKFDGEYTKDAISAWVRGNSLPLIDEIGPNNYKAYVETNLPMGMFFVKLDADYFDDVLATARSVAGHFRGQVNFVYVDANKYIQQAQKVGLSGNVVPSFAIDYVTEGKHFAFDETAALEASALTTYTRGVLDGSIKQTIKSEPVPDSNDGPVKVVVASQFEQIVNDPTKDVFVEFYAPWCGHCKKLEPLFAELGEHFASSKSVVIAKMDATANDVPTGTVQVRGFPTLAFFPANDKLNPVMYNGDRTVDAMRDFVVENADLPIDGADDEDGHEHGDIREDL